MSGHENNGPHDTEQRTRDGVLILHDETQEMLATAKPNVTAAAAFRPPDRHGPPQRAARPNHR